MSRQSGMPSRNLTLTEELERLEQSITLVLQEIDHNFSRAHRIVSGSIIPIVEQYAKHSDSVWEGSKFWKQFFEASANVSLSSYEEAAEEDLTVTDHSQATDPYTDGGQDQDDTVTASGQKTSSHVQDELEDSSILNSPSVTFAQHGTPRAQQTSTHTETSFADYSSPYENLKEEMGDSTHNKIDKSTAPSTPGRPSVADNAQTPRNQSSPAIPPSTSQQNNTRRQNNDPLLHRVLDKNYRIGTTPHTSRKNAPSSSHGQSATVTGQRDMRTAPRANSALDSSPFSPAIAAPELRSEIFGSPTRDGPRTPGVSVQKGKGKMALGSARKNPFVPQPTQTEQQRTPADATAWNDKLWDSDSDTNDDLGMSPPKTMQFHVPQSRLMQTPAKEASRRIVEDLLSTAGAASVTSTLDEFDLDLGGGDGYGRGGVGEDDSPSVVRMARRDEDDDF